jgi:hypothetical protein
MSNVGITLDNLPMVLQMSVGSKLEEVNSRAKISLPTTFLSEGM